MLCALDLKVVLCWALSCISLRGVTTQTVQGSPEGTAELRASHRESQQVVHFKSRKPIERHLRKKMGRLSGFVRAVDVPVRVYCMIGRDALRKPGAAAWHHMVDADNGASGNAAGQTPLLGRARPCFQRSAGHWLLAPWSDVVVSAIRGCSILCFLWLCCTAHGAAPQGALP